jgi:hypothetical protein
MQVKTVNELPTYKEYLAVQKSYYTNVDAEHLYTKAVEGFFGDAYYLELIRIASEGHEIPKRVINSLPKNKRAYMKENFTKNGA